MAVPWRSRRRSPVVEPREREQPGLDAPSWVQPGAPERAPVGSGTLSGDDGSDRDHPADDHLDHDRPLPEWPTAGRGDLDLGRADQDDPDEDDPDQDDPERPEAEVDVELLGDETAGEERLERAVPFGIHVVEDLDGDPDDGPGSPARTNDLLETKPPETELPETELPETEPVETDRADTEPRGTLPADSEQAEDEPPEPDRAESEPTEIRRSASARAESDVEDDRDEGMAQDSLPRASGESEERRHVEAIQGPEPSGSEPAENGTTVERQSIEGEVMTTETIVKTVGPTDGPILDPETLPTAGPNSTMPMVLPRVVAIANQKGGVGKTTTAVNLGAALAELGFRVLIVDLDPQGNATTGLGVNPRDVSGSVYDVMLNDVALEDVIEPTTLRNLFVAPATIDLAGAEIELVPVMSRELKLRKAIDTVRGEYDMVFIDCPPSLGLLTVNGLAAADDVIVPIQCEYYALEGLGQLLRNVGLVQANLNQSLDVRGIILTMYDARTRLADQVESEVRNYFGTKVYRTVVPRTVRLSEAPSFGQPIIVFDSTSRGAQAYRELAKEVSRGATRRAG